jgi:hypothetical protein
MAEFRGKTAEEVSEKLGLYVREKIAAGAPIGEVVMIMMRTPDGYAAAAGSRDGLLAQVAAMDPKAAREMRRDLKPRPGYIPIIAIDPIDREHGIEWIGPFPNAPGGSS